MWRGVRGDLREFHLKGKQFPWWAVTSCTTSLSVLENPNFLGKLEKRTMFSIQTNRGRSIRGHSYFQHEDEILLPPGVFLQTVDSISPAADLYIIQLREIAPPYPLLADPFDLSQLKWTLPKLEPPLKIAQAPTTSKTVSQSSTKGEHIRKILLQCLCESSRRTSLFRIKE